MLDHFKNIGKGSLIFPASLFAFLPFVAYGFLAWLVLFLLSPFHPKLSYIFSQYSLKMSKSFDQFANASLHGNEDQTISGRIGYYIHTKYNPNKALVILCKLLSYIFKQGNHCKESIEFDRLE